MKKLVLIAFALVLFSLATARAQGHNDHGQAAASTSTTAPTFSNESATHVYQAYISLTQALVQSDESKSLAAAQAFAQKTEASEAGAELKAAAKKLAATSNLNALRLELAEASPLLKTWIAEQMTSGEIYVAHCPMANGNIGGYWLANEKQINNPYFGDKMLRCGSVKETLQ
ncbi:DUF3347 domain-containing protein [Cytophagales bacterium LB-30]|uniref:DUF3347 domain-containing protein n=1 Tax=Shiella aurantiaca TaxID=3058365 RepID=A0ABT8F960_9BACT|nr:DUF3347 domain-containing protein [Shiella aurantiaca]MDN4167011.1 DUF3347 domain-containing protein [Shiella aurantiaca]